MVVHSVTSNQTDIYKDLEAVVRKYASTTFLRPVADHTRTAFERACEFVRSFASQAGCTCGPFSLVLDSGCGTGESTLHLARRFPDYPVIGIDKSAVRLDKAAQSANRLAESDATHDLPRNAFYVRAELIDFWRLALDKVKAGQWNIPYHALYYPNPWPKQSEAGRRFHLHPIFPTLLQLAQETELRTNWEVYAQEFALAAKILGYNATVLQFSPNPPQTAFERKYNEARQTLWRVTISH